MSPHHKIDTLIIIGNGFDIWQGLNTSYSQFEAYYHEHLDEILKELHIKKRTLLDDNDNPVLDKKGTPITYSDVELFFGNPFEPDKLPHNFWSTFEASLDKLDDQQLNLFFGKDRRGLKGIKKSAINAQRILRKAFCDWIGTIEIEEKEKSYHFGDNCLFINFNYTDTLIKRFQVHEDYIYHIHGEATDKESIIFGHATHPEYALPILKRMGGRFEGLYYVEEALYYLDKHVEDNYTKLCEFFALHGAMMDEIQHVYVLGHSIGKADQEYFENLVRATQDIDDDPEADLSVEEKRYLDNADAESILNLNIQYAIHHRERVLGIQPIPYPELEKIDELMFQAATDPYYRMSLEQRMHLEMVAVRRRYWCEQQLRDEEEERKFFRKIRKALRKSGKTTAIETEEDEKPVVDEQIRVFPKWHISYYSKDDKKRIEEVMKEICCEDYELYGSIDDCLKAFKN